MNKKITSSALAALMIAGSTSFSALAAMTNGTVVIGTKAFDLAYANDPANADEIGNAIVGMAAGAAVYVKGFDGNWVENTTGKTVEASVIPAVTYKDAAGKVSEITKGDAGSVVVDGSLKLKSVKAISNTKVEVKLEEAVKAVDTSNFKIVKKGTTTALEIKTATLSEDGKVVVIEAAAMIGGDSYALTLNEIVKNFTAVKVVKEQLTVKKVEQTDANVVTVTFDKIADQVSAENIENYKVNNSVVVTGAKLSADRLSVDLTATGIVSKSKYRVETLNVLSADGVAMKTKQIKDFVAKSFVGAPKVKSVKNQNHYNNERLLVEFTTTGNDLDKESAENVENYKIAGLEVLSAKLDTDDTNKIVTLVTSTQAQGKTYTLKVNNIADASVLKNVITKEVSKDFKGGYLDKKAPTLVKTNDIATSNTEVRVYFNDDNKLDSTTALDASNYVFDKDITVETVEFLDAEDPYSEDGRTVVLTTSAQEAKSYKLTVKNVQDEYGNILTKGDMRITGKATDIIPPYVKAIKATAQNKVEITFDDVVDKKTAVDPTNYVVLDSNGDKVSSALSAKFVSKSQNKQVEIVVPELDKNKTYSIKMDGITDTTGNAMVGVKVKVVTPNAENDTTAPTIKDVNVIAKNEIVVEFDETIKDQAITLTTRDGGITFTGKKLYDNGTKLIMTPSVNLAEKEYEIMSGTGIVDMNRNTFENTAISETGYKFPGFSGDNSAPEAEGEQINVKTVRFVFDQPVDLPSSVVVTGGGTNWSVDYAEGSDADSYDELCVLEYKSSSVIKVDSKLSFNLTAVKDFAGTSAIHTDDVENKTIIEAFAEDKTAPVINAVEAVSNQQINITFDEELEVGGSYKISYEDSKGNTQTFSATGTLKSTDKSIVELKSFSKKLDADTTYTLKVVNSARDIAGNLLDKTDVEESFVGSSVVPSANIVSGVVVNEPNVVTISGVTAVANGNVSFDGVKIGYTVSESAKGVNNKVTALIPFLSGVTYTVNTTTDSAISFSGSVENDKNLQAVKDNGAVYIAFEGMTDLVSNVQDGFNYELVVYTTTGSGVTLNPTAVLTYVEDKGYMLTNGNVAGEVVYAYLYKKQAADTGKTLIETYLDKNVMSGAKITIAE